MKKMLLFSIALSILLYSCSSSKKSGFAKGVGDDNVDNDLYFTNVAHGQSEFAERSNDPYIAAAQDQYANATGAGYAYGGSLTSNAPVSDTSSKGNIYYAPTTAYQSEVYSHSMPTTSYSISYSYGYPYYGYGYGYGYPYYGYGYPYYGYGGYYPPYYGYGGYYPSHPIYYPSGGGSVNYGPRPGGGSGSNAPRPSGSYRPASATVSSPRPVARPTNTPPPTNNANGINQVDRNPVNNTTRPTAAPVQAPTNAPAARPSNPSYGGGSRPSMGGGSIRGGVRGR